VTSILRRARGGERLRVVAEQVTAPTYTRNLPAPWRDGLRRYLAERGELAPSR